MRCGGFAREYRRAKALHAQRRARNRELLREDTLTVRDKFALLPRVLPFVILLTGVMIALYGGYATPSETAGLGAVLALLLIALHLQRLDAARSRADPGCDVARIDHADVHHRHVAALFLCDELSAHQPVDGAVRSSTLHLSRWVLLAAILLMVVVLGFFLPPVSIILMTAPIILPPLKAAGFDLIWFGVVMTIVMEMGLIHPPVGLNIFVIKNIAPDIPLRDVIWGVMPFVVLMMVSILLLCVFPGIATWFSDAIMGSRREM